MASISYDTAATSLTYKECEEILRPVVNAILPKMGININTARTVVFGTSKYGVLGLDHMYVVQGFAQLQYLIGSLRTQDTMGDLYQMLLEYTQLECDTDTLILEADFTTYQPEILTKKWITEWWRYISLCKATMAITGIWAPTKARQGDTELMDEFIKQDMTDSQLKDGNRCRVYLQSFHISDITDLAGNTIEEWVKRGKRQSNRTSKWNWPVQQIPTDGAWKNWDIALQGIATDDNDLYRCLRPWEASLLTHQMTEWNLDATTLSLFRHHEGVWIKHRATNYGRLRFELIGTITEALRHVTHKADGVQRQRYIDLTNVYGVIDCAYEGDHNRADSIYTSSTGECFHALPKHVRRLVRNIPELDLPADFNCTEPTDQIIATDGSVLFGVRYHSWLIATKTEQVILRGGGPDNGSPTYMTSYRSELGGICAGLAAIGVLARSSRINLRSVRMVCDNEAAIKRCNQKLTASIYQNTEYDWDLLKTYHTLREECCRDIPTKVQWVKGHADREGRDLTRDERLNILADLLSDTTRANARGPYVARHNCPHWPVEKATLFIEGPKVTSGMKQQLASHLSDGKLHNYIIDKEKWSQYTFDSVAWSEYETAFKGLSKNRQVNISKACFNLWHTGRKNMRYYGGKKGYCMCNTQEEDWIHILTCPSIEACMNREESQVKARKTMKHWKLPNYFWTALEKGVHGFARHSVGGAIDTPFPPIYDNRPNHLKLAFREQDGICWDNLLKGRMGKKWKEYVKKHLKHEHIKLQAKEWAPRKILALWDHMLRLWQYRNNALHEDDSTRVAQFKIEALDRDIEQLAARHNDLRSKLHEVQERQMEQR
jgi:hypothetical protein